MSGALTKARKDLALAIREALGEDTRATVHDHVPTELTGLDVILTTASDAIVPSETFDPLEWIAALEVYVVVGGEDNSEVHDNLTDLLPSVVLAMQAADWPPSTTSRFMQFETAAWASYGISLRATQHLHLL